ncbi:NAD(P)H-hydrate dehydratase [Candidatus Poribacteria bacterium]
MKVVTAQEMRNIDTQAINETGIPGIVLMENAGVGVVHVIEGRRCDSRLFPGTSSCPLRISIFAGKGNNGGDGLVIARHLINRGHDVTIYLISEPDDFTGDALTNLKIAQNMQIPIEIMLSEDQLADCEHQIIASDLLIDAIFGTGLKGAIVGFPANVIDFLNRSGVPIVAVDLPSGLEADTGRVEGSCIRATLTVAMALPKRGLLLYPGAGFVGELQIADIGIPYEVMESQNIQVDQPQASDIATLLPIRRRDAHKGSFGKALILAGSVGFTGAAALASEAALRIGAGLVTLGIPESLNTVMEVKLTEVMTRPLPETESQSLASEARDEIMDLVDGLDVVALGPGLSRDPETVSLVRQLCREIRIPKVIDADGLNALAEDRDVLKDLSSQTILTPHPGEMARLMGCSISDVQSDRIGVAQDFAKENGIVLVLKGVPTVTTDPLGMVYLNSTGNPGLASGGTGDVLTGAIAGLLAQGLDAIDAAILGVYVHGLAGDLAAEAQGEAGMLAGDVLRHLPAAIQQLSRSNFPF